MKGLHSFFPFFLPFSPIASYQMLTNVKEAGALKAVASFTTNPEVNYLFFWGGGKETVVCGIFVLVHGLGSLRASLRHFQLGASCPVPQLRRQGGSESD